MNQPPLLTFNYGPDTLGENRAATWMSGNYGQTWSRTPLNSSTAGTACYTWDPAFVDPDPAGNKPPRLWAGCYRPVPNRDMRQAPWAQDQGWLQVSDDRGRSWTEPKQVPEWFSVNEVTMIRAKNGDLVAACRTDPPKRFQKTQFDHYCGLGVSISKDNGATWSKLSMLYEWGRHHPSVILLPNGVLVMTYVVRLGYALTAEGYEQFGIEAIVSRDKGRSWDLDHRYILHSWHANETGPAAWIAGCQSTSSVLLPDGWILTAFGTGHRAKALPPPKWRTAMDIGLVRWKLNPAGEGRTGGAITKAPFDSPLRNEFNPNPAPHRRTPTGTTNLATREAGAVVSSSAADDDPNLLRHNIYAQPVVTLNTIPAWVEIRWRKKHRVDEIRIHPGAPCRPGWPIRRDALSTPLDYQLQYWKDGVWADLIAPVKNAEQVRAFRKRTQWNAEFELTHRFPPTEVDRLRLLILRSGDPGKRESQDKAVIPEESRQTVLRYIEVFSAK